MSWVPRSDKSALAGHTLPFSSGHAHRTQAQPLAASWYCMPMLGMPVLCMTLGVTGGDGLDLERRVAGCSQCELCH